MNYRSLVASLVLAALAACSTPAAVKQAGDTTGTVSLARTVRITGAVMAPAGLIANNGSGVISDGGGSVVSNNGGSFISRPKLALLAIVETGLAGTEVFVSGADGKPLPGVASVRTDATGKFTLPGVPPGLTLILHARATNPAGTSAELVTLVPLRDGAPAAVNTATTFVAAYLHLGDRAGLGSLNGPAYQQAVAVIASKLTDADAALLGDDAAVSARAAELLAGEPAAAIVAQDLARDPISTATLVSQAAKDASAAPSARPSAPPSAAPPASPSATPKATAAPSATAPAGLPSQLPSPLAPTITGFDAPEVLPGGTVGIIGTNFTSGMVVTIGGKSTATPTVTNGSLAKVTVPAGAVGGAVQLQLGAFRVDAPAALALAQIPANYPTPSKPASLAFGLAGEIWFKNDSSNLGKLNGDGSVGGAFPVPNGVGSLDVDDGGNPWVIGPFKIYKLGTDGTILAQAAVNTAPNDVVTDATGGAWVSSPYGVERFGADGVRTAKYDFTGGAACLKRRPGGGIRYRNGQIYHERDAGGVLLRTVDLGKFINDYTADAAGNVWAATDGGVKRIDAAGNVTVVGTAKMKSIALDPQGNVWAGDGAVVEVRTPTGTLLARLDGSNFVSVATDRGGTVWLADDKAKRIVKVSL
ncbi:MAG: hypothetical protein JWM80_4522 [Cyanobacteria bacterium RYN_339]|nr:hypothetical protein [Cyanobacteria bacterium RYN_339]